mgnify:FL=1
MNGLKSAKYKSLASGEDAFGGCVRILASESHVLDHTYLLDGVIAMNLDLFRIRYVAPHLVTGPGGRLGLEQAHGKVVMTRGLRESYTPLVHAQHPTALGSPCSF